MSENDISETQRQKGQLRALVVPIYKCVFIINKHEMKIYRFRVLN